MGAAAFAAVPRDARLREAPAPLIDHRRFGPMRASLRRDSHAFIWECLDLVPTPRGAADLEFEAGAWGPAAAHEQQLAKIIEDLDALTDASALAVAARFGIERSAADPCGLEWQGARLTGYFGSFQLHYWYRADPELLVTVLFERSQPRAVHIHV